MPASARTNENPHPWPQRKKSSKLRWPKYVPNHSEPFRDPLVMDRTDWAAVYGFMAARRQLSLVDLSDKVRAYHLAALPKLIAYMDHRCIDPRLANRSHTCLDLSATPPAKREPTRNDVAPADALDSLEALLTASLAATRR